MRIGIFARTFKRDSLSETLRSICDVGLDLVHFNMACAGVSSLPDSISDELIGQIRAEFQNFGLEMAGISGTFNAIDPDVRRREENARRCMEIIRKAPDLGTHLVSLCTGTRDPENMWRRHQANDTPEAWEDLTATLEPLIATAEEAGVHLGVEPETANVVDSAPRARRLLDQIKSDRLKIIIDGANLFTAGTTINMAPVLKEAFDLLGPDIIMAHAKDIPRTPSGSQAAGTGILDWRCYFHFMKESGFRGPVILHNLEESQVPECVEFVANEGGVGAPI